MQHKMKERVNVEFHIFCCHASCRIYILILYFRFEHVLLLIYIYRAIFTTFWEWLFWNECLQDKKIQINKNDFNQYVEPVGAKAPTFSSDSKGSIFVRSEHSSFAILCQAQAFPVPLIR